MLINSDGKDIKKTKIYIHKNLKHKLKSIFLWQRNKIIIGKPKQNKKNKIHVMVDKNRIIQPILLSIIPLIIGIITIIFAIHIQRKYIYPPSHNIRLRKGYYRLSKWNGQSIEFLQQEPITQEVLHKGETDICTQFRVSNVFFDSYGFAQNEEPMENQQWQCINCEFERDQEQWVPHQYRSHIEYCICVPLNQSTGGDEIIFKEGRKYVLNYGDAVLMSAGLENQFKWKGNFLFIFYRVYPFFEEDSSENGISPILKSRLERRRAIKADKLWAKLHRRKNI